MASTTTGDDQEEAEDGPIGGGDVTATQAIPQGTDKLDSTLSSLPPR